MGLTWISRCLWRDKPARIAFQSSHSMARSAAPAKQRLQAAICIAPSLPVARSKVRKWTGSILSLRDFSHVQAAGSLALGPIRFGFQDGDSITARIWPAGRRRLLSLRNGSANTEPNKLSSQDFQRASSLDTPLQAACQPGKQTNRFAADRVR